LSEDGSISAGGLDEEEEDDWGSLGLGHSEIERVSLGSPSEDDRDGFEMFGWSSECSPRRKVEVGR
jgi:hypothetical protein